MVRKRPWVSETTHKRVKKFAANHDLDIQEAYDQILQNVLNEHGENNTNIDLIDRGMRI